MGTAARQTWALIKPYWTSRDRWIGLAMLATLIGLAFAQVKIQVQVTYWIKDFYGSMEKRDTEKFFAALAWSLVIFGSRTVMTTADTYLRQFLEIRWRTVLTEHLTQRWFAGDAFYRIERLRSADNPDQRIAEDAALFVRKTIELGLSIISSVTGLVTFGLLLWTLGGSMTYSVGGHSLTIPGFLFWAALGFAALQTSITHLAGRKLSQANFDQQRAEADYRFSLAQIRDNAEQIALYGGTQAEVGRLRGLFGEVRLTWRRVMTHTKRLNFARSAVGSYTSFIPMLLSAPKLFSGELSLGSLLQIQSVFGGVVIPLEWFAFSYSELAQWLAISRRLRLLQQATDAKENSGILVERGASRSVALQGLAMHLPDGRPLASLTSTQLEPGDRCLVRGRSGIGKSTMLRAIAGLWPYGQGRVTLPAQGRVLFLPQRSYIPPGTLRAAVAYPAEPDRYSDEACRQALNDCLLPHLSDSLDESARWSLRLSLGEQQRLAFARALLARPDVLFLDEATSALDSENEARLYRLLQERLPAATIVSVAHRVALDAFHDKQIVVHAETSAPANQRKENLPCPTTSST